jgi:isopenicillin N synthase-like dioxygenase
MIAIVNLEDNSIDNCKKLLESLHMYGCVIIKDEKIKKEDNDNFINIMKLYFSQNKEIKELDTRQELGYQIGYTPENTEVPKCSTSEKCLEYISSLSDLNKPILPEKNKSDPKCRYFWKIGSNPEKTDFPELNTKDQIIPKQIMGFEYAMDKWGNSLMDSLYKVTELLSIGLCKVRDRDSEDSSKSEFVNEFKNLIKDGPHLLAPTGSNLSNVKKNDVLAGFHADMNFLTIHGKSNFPGLEIWNTDGEKIRVVIPDDCLLVQAGDQLEMCTGGYIKAGYHQVIVNEACLSRVENKSDKESIWRVSSTLFSHIASDKFLMNYLEKDKKEKIKAGDFINDRLTKINLK